MFSLVKRAAVGACSCRRRRRVRKPPPPLPPPLLRKGLLPKQFHQPLYCIKQQWELFLVASIVCGWYSCLLRIPCATSFSIDARGHFSHAQQAISPANTIPSLAWPQSVASDVPNQSELIGLFSVFNWRTYLIDQGVRQFVPNQSELIGLFSIFNFNRESSSQYSPQKCCCSSFLRLSILLLIKRFPRMRYPSEKIDFLLAYLWTIT